MSSQIWPKLSADALHLVCRDVGLKGGPHKKSDMLKFLGSVDQIGLEHALDEYNNDSSGNTNHEALAIAPSSLPVKRKRGRPRKNQIAAPATSVPGSGAADAGTTKHKDDGAPVAPQSSSSSSQKKRKLPVDIQEDKDISSNRVTRTRKPSLKLRESKNEEENTETASTFAAPTRSQYVSQMAPKKPESRQQNQRDRRNKDQDTQSQVNSKTKWVFDGVVIEVGAFAWSNKPSSSSAQQQGGSMIDGIEWSEEDAPYEMEDSLPEFNWDTALDVASALSQAMTVNGQASNVTTQTSSPIEGSEKENAPPIPQSFQELDSAHLDDEHEYIPYPSIISGRTTPAQE